MASNEKREILEDLLERIGGMSPERAQEVATEILKAGVSSGNTDKTASLELRERLGEAAQAEWDEQFAARTSEEGGVRIGSYRVEDVTPVSDEQQTVDEVDEMRQAEIIQMIADGAKVEMFSGIERDFVETITDPSSPVANQEAIEAMAQVAADETDANERSLFNQVFSEEMRQAAVDDFNASNVGQDVESYNELLERYANQDPQAMEVIQNSVMGQASNYVRIATGIGPNGVEYEYLDTATNEAFKERGLNPVEVATVMRGQKYHGINVDAAVAITNYTNMLGGSGNPGKLLELNQQLERARAQAEEASKFASADPERARFLRQRVQALEAEIAKEREGDGGQASRVNQAYVSQNMARYQGFLETYGGHYDLALIAMRDPSLANRIYSQGNVVGLTSEDFATIQDVFVQAGVRNRETGKNLIGGEGAANADLPGVTDEQMAMLMGLGDPSGGGGGGTSYKAFTMPDPEQVKESLKSVYASWYMSEPTAEELDAFVNVINTKTKAEAMKHLPPEAASGGAMRYWGDTSSNYADSGGGGTVLLGNHSVDQTARAFESARADSEYAELFAHKGDETEAQYAAQFGGQATAMLGVEGGTAYGAIQQGMRSGDVNAVSRMALFDKKYRNNSTLMGRMATGANAIARYI